jgi:uncharacterized phage-associated protein
MPYDARIIANYFIDLSRQDYIPLTPLKIQKLVYLAHGWSLVLHGKPLIRESPEAWRYGPVIPELYHEFRRFGGSVITEKANVGQQAELDEESRGLIESVWEKYKNFSASQLSTMTHEPGSAWQMTIKNSWPFEPLTITDAQIADEFQRRQQQANAKAAR